MKNFLLPLRVVNLIQAAPKSKKEKEILLKIVEVIFDKQIIYGGVWAPISKFIFGGINRNYKDYIDWLEGVGLIDVDHYYSKKLKITKKYKIKLDKIEDKYVALKRKIKKESLLSQKHISIINKLGKRIEVDYDAAYKFIEENAEPEIRKRLTILCSEDEIESSVIQVNGYNRKKERALESANDWGKDLIKYSHKGAVKYHLDYFDKVLGEKVKEYILTRKVTIEKLRNKIIYPTRSVRNERLYSTMAMCPSDIYPFIKINGEEIWQIDMASSQTTFLYNYLRDEVFRGKLERELDVPNVDCINPNELDELEMIIKKRWVYESMQQKFELSSRDEAKIMMFKIFYTKRQLKNCKEKNLFRKDFPTIMEWVFELQEKNEDNSIAYFLQRLESYVFIDSIYFELLRRGYNCFSVHDSIIAPKSQIEKINVIVQNILDDMDLIYRLSDPEKK
jgi:hypothetical protein